MEPSSSRLVRKSRKGSCLSVSISTVNWIRDLMDIVLVKSVDV